MKQILLVLLLSTLLILHANCSNLRRLEETQSELPQQETQPELHQQETESNQNNQEQQDNTSNEQEQLVDQYNGSENENRRSHDHSEEEKNENMNDEFKDDLIAQKIFELIEKGLQLNEDRNDLLKIIHQISIKNFVEEPSSLSNENISDLRSRLQENQEAIEELKAVNKKLQKIQQQLFSLII